MSSTLVWEPVIKTTNQSLDCQLKFILRKRQMLPAVFRSKDIDYLTGLVDCDIRGAQELIDAILSHGEVKVYEEY